ncbi:TetR/AcrR family transcriptional regulator [Mangrovimicrobium sediminis]|nr:TetR/AcrR family transcriptional regulator [Haliea sp. SAOS-164]
MPVPHSASSRTAPSGLPDPFLPMLSTPSHEPECPASAEAGNQRSRRASILAMTRKLLASSTQKGLTVREIAAACGTSVQTIHNNFGSRHALLACAINEHTTALDRNAFSATPGPAMFLNIGKLYHQCAVETPAFLHEMVTAAFSDKWQLMPLLQPHSTRHKATFIRHMSEQRLLRDYVDPERLASQITRINTISIFDWSQHGDTDELHSQIMDGVTLLLLGALRKEFVPSVEAWLAAERAQPPAN